jgi:hypothetical protein
MSKREQKVDMHKYTLHRGHDGNNPAPKEISVSVFNLKHIYAIVAR